MSQTKVNSHLSITKLPCCRRQFQVSSRTHLIALFFVVTVAGFMSGQILSRPMSAMLIERCTVPLVGLDGLEVGDQVVVVEIMGSGQRSILRCEAANPLPVLVQF